jgi:ACS family hexuronate transporter-like MFS transporter
MLASAEPRHNKLDPILHLRWWIGGMLFASTVVNYIDRQTLSALAPFLKQEYHWTNGDYACLVIAFRIAYAVGQTVLGRVMDPSTLAAASPSPWPATRRWRC